MNRKGAPSRRPSSPPPPAGSARSSRTNRLAGRCPLAVLRPAMTRAGGRCPPPVNRSRPAAQPRELERAEGEPVRRIGRDLAALRLGREKEPAGRELRVRYETRQAGKRRVANLPHLPPDPHIVEKNTNHGAPPVGYAGTQCNERATVTCVTRSARSSSARPGGVALRTPQGDRSPSTVAFHTSRDRSAISAFARCSCVIPFVSTTST